MRIAVVFCILCYVLIAVPLNSYSFKMNNKQGSSTKLNLFGWGKKNDIPSNPKTTSASKPVDAERLNQMKQKLEKVSNKQNRNYNAEAAEAAANAAPPVMRDLQKPSKPDDFPNLYKGWIKGDGDQIAKQIIKSSNAALKAKEKYIEVLFDPVPNLDEVAFGTEWNKKLRKEVVKNLKVPEYAANKGGPVSDDTILRLSAFFIHYSM